MGTKGFITYCNTAVTGGYIYPPPVTLRSVTDCYVTVTLFVGYVCSLRDSVTSKLLSVTLGVLRFLCQLGQCLWIGGQGVRFEKNDGNCNVSPASRHGLVANEISGLIVI